MRTERTRRSRRDINRDINQILMALNSVDVPTTLFVDPAGAAEQSLEASLGDVTRPDRDIKSGDRDINRDIKIALMSLDLPFVGSMPCLLPDTSQMSLEPHRRRLSGLFSEGRSSCLGSMKFGNRDIKDIKSPYQLSLCAHARTHRGEFGKNDVLMSLPGGGHAF